MTTLRAEKLTSCCSNGSDGPYRRRLTNHSSSVLSYSPGGANVQTQLTQFLGPMQVFTQNSISIGSAAFARLTDVANGHAETYRPRHVETSAAKKTASVLCLVACDGATVKQSSHREISVAQLNNRQQLINLIGSYRANITGCFGLLLTIL